MNTLELWSALKSDFLLARKALGVFPADKIPTRSVPETCFIANTQPSTDPGEHWVCFYSDDDNTCYYFDSYGMPPSPLFAKFLQAASASVCNGRTVQSDLSSCCGAYCLYYLALQSRDYSHDEIMATLQRTREKNDKRVVKFVNAHFDLNTPVTDIDFIVSQIATRFH